MTHEIADWVNRSGMILGFVAFWFAAPEFIGDKRLRAWEEALLQRELLKLPVAAKATLLITLDCVIGLYLLTWVRSAGGKGVDITPVQLVAVALASATVLFADLITDNILRPAIAKLVSRLTDAGARQHSLFFGGALFTISFVLQLTATFKQVSFTTLSVTRYTMPYVRRQSLCEKVSRWRIMSFISLCLFSSSSNISRLAYEYSER
jgi:hypothetical protein